MLRSLRIPFFLKWLGWAWHSTLFSKVRVTNLWCSLDTPLHASLCAIRGHQKCRTICLIKIWFQHTRGRQQWQLKRIPKIILNHVHSTNSYDRKIWPLTPLDIKFWGSAADLRQNSRPTRHRGYTSRAQKRKTTFFLRKDLCMHSISYRLKAMMFQWHCSDIVAFERHWYFCSKFQLLDTRWAMSAGLCPRQNLTQLHRNLSRRNVWLQL